MRSNVDRDREPASCASAQSVTDVIRDGLQEALNDLGSQLNAKRDLSAVTDAAYPQTVAGLFAEIDRLRRLERVVVELLEARTDYFAFLARSALEGDRVGITAARARLCSLERRLSAAIDPGGT